MVVLVVAAAADSGALFIAGALVGGAGFGMAFLGGLRTLVRVIPEEHNAAVLSAFYLVAYAAISLPAVAAGLAVDSLGLRPTFEIFGSVVAAIALIVALEAWRTRPRPVQRTSSGEDCWQLSAQGQTVGTP
jgi:predicted MFS family arabinose efflux permease